MTEQVIRFDEDTHTYYCNGVVVPSVTQILRFASREVYKDVKPLVLKRAADRGTAVHKLTEFIDRECVVSCKDELSGYVKAYCEFLAGYSPMWEIIEEKRAYAPHDKALYCGTIDRVGIINGKRHVLDIKTTSVMHPLLAGAQMYAYGLMVGCNNYACLRLCKDGTYELKTDFDKARCAELWETCLKLHYLKISEGE